MSDQAQDGTAQDDADELLLSTVGGRIRAVRMAKDLSGELFAEKLKIVRPTLCIGKLARRKRYQTKNLQRSPSSPACRRIG